VFALKMSPPTGSGKRAGRCLPATVENRHISCISSRQEPRIVRRPSIREVAIRTLAVGLIAVAALVASLTIARQRADQRSVAPDLDSASTQSEPLLDAIRTAGL
jgi:hypothetical protein